MFVSDVGMKVLYKILVLIFILGKDSAPCFACKSRFFNNYSKLETSRNFSFLRISKMLIFANI